MKTIAYGSPRKLRTLCAAAVPGGGYERGPGRESLQDALPAHTCSALGVPASVGSAASCTCLSCAKATGPSGPRGQRRKKHSALGSRGTRSPNTKDVSECWYFYPKRYWKEICNVAYSLFCGLLLRSFSDRFPLLSYFLLFLPIVPPLMEMHLYENSAHIHFWGNFLVCIPSKISLMMCEGPCSLVVGLWEHRGFTEVIFFPPHPADYRETWLPSRDQCHQNIWFLVSQVLFVFDRDISSCSDAYMM